MTAYLPSTAAHTSPIPTTPTPKKLTMTRSPLYSPPPSPTTTKANSLIAALANPESLSTATLYAAAENAQAELLAWQTEYSKLSHQLIIGDEDYARRKKKSPKKETRRPKLTNDRITQGGAVRGTVTSAGLERRSILTRSSPDKTTATVVTVVTATNTEHEPAVSIKKEQSSSPPTKRSTRDALAIEMNKTFLAPSNNEKRIRKCARRFEHAPAATTTAPSSAARKRKAPTELESLAAKEQPAVKRVYLRMSEQNRAEMEAEAEAEVKIEQETEAPMIARPNRKRKAAAFDASTALRSTNTPGQGHKRKRDSSTTSTSSSLSTLTTITTITTTPSFLTPPPPPPTKTSGTRPRPAIINDEPTSPKELPVPKVVNPILSARARARWEKRRAAGTNGRYGGEPKAVSAVRAASEAKGRERERMNRGNGWDGA
ncbi:hypothetical protein MMC21_000579 [Puttea exsequens]|nr:hypothetical protein [Puttea exsequens]